MYDRLTRVVATLGSGLGRLHIHRFADFKTVGNDDADGEQVCSGNLYDFGEN